jgi:hypothetical protein
MSNSFDRRRSPRYSIALNAQFTMRKRGTVISSGVGQIRNVSGAGIFFESPTVLPIGGALRMTVEWPVRFEGRVRIDWIVDAVVVRSTAAGTAVSIMRHRFERRLRSKEKKMTG